MFKTSTALCFWVLCAASVSVCVCICVAKILELCKCHPRSHFLGMYAANFAPHKCCVSWSNFNSLPAELWLKLYLVILVTMCEALRTYLNGSAELCCLCHIGDGTVDCCFNIISYREDVDHQALLAACWMDLVFEVQTWTLPEFDANMFFVHHT